MPFDFYTARLATLGTTSDPSYSQSVFCDSEEPVVFFIEFDVEGSDTGSLQLQVSTDNEGWVDSGSPLTANGPLETGRLMYFRFKLTNTTGTPTEPIYVNVKGAVFCTNSGGSFHRQGVESSYARNLQGLADTLTSERANLTIFGDSITNMSAPTFMGYGFHRTWRPNYFAGQCISPSTGAANVSGYITGGPTNQSTAASFVTSYSSNAPDPEQPDTDIELQALGLSPYAPGSDFLTLQAIGDHSDAQVLCYRANPVKAKWNGLDGVGTLFVGKNQTHSVDTYVANTSHRFSALIYAKQPTNILFFPRNWSNASNTSVVVPLVEGWNIIRGNTGQDGNFDATVTNYHEIYSRMFSGQKIGIIKTKDDAADIPGLAIDYIGGGGWESFDHTVESSDDAQNQTFDYPPADNDLDGTRKTYYLNESVQKALEFHETNVVMIWLGQNDDVSDDYEANIIATVERIKSNASAVGLNPKFLFISPYLTANQGTTAGIKFRKQRDILIKLSKSLDAGFIDLQQMILDKHGEFSSWTGTYLADNIHPNTTGALEFAELIWTEIDKARTI